MFAADGSKADLNWTRLGEDAKGQPYSGKSVRYWIVNDATPSRATAASLTTR